MRTIFSATTTVILALLLVASSSSSSSSVQASFGDDVLLQRQKWSADSYSGQSKTIHVTCSPDKGGELQAAAESIRKLQPLKFPVYVNITGTCVSSSPDVPVLELDGALDSGNWPHIITYQSANPGASSGGIISGGKKIPFSAWKPYKNDILVASFADIGFTVADAGKIVGNSGLGQCNSDRTRLFLNQEPQTLARTPNNPKQQVSPNMNWLQVDSVQNEKTTFSVKSGDHALKTLSDLKNLTGQDVWGWGFWSFDWADGFSKIDRIIKSQLFGEFQITAAESTPPVYGFKDKARFQIFNHESLLDSPGEYFVDTDKKQILFWPPSNKLTENDLLVLSQHGQDLITQKNPHKSAPLQGVTISSLQISYGRASALSLPNTKGQVKVLKNDIFGFSKECASISGTNYTFMNNKVSMCGCSGIHVGGGSLEKTKINMCHANIDQNLISWVGQSIRSYNPHISYSLVGAFIGGNVLKNGGHAAILGHIGNDVTIAGNTISNVLYGCRDCGAFYTGRSWLHGRGTEITNNLFNNIVSAEPTFLGSDLIAATYLDDEMSGININNNVFSNIGGRLPGCAVLLGGGRDNTIQNITGSAITGPMIHFDDRGLTWQKEYCTPPNGQLVKGVESVDYQQPPYSWYRGMKTTVSFRPCVPVGNTITNNKCISANQGFLTQSLKTIESWNSTASNNTIGKRCM